VPASDQPRRLNHVAQFAESEVELDDEVRLLVPRWLARALLLLKRRARHLLANIVAIMAYIVGAEMAGEGGPRHPQNLGAFVIMIRFEVVTETPLRF
jgi:hypothetical protein